jgi:predicted transcriptional regulator
MIPEKTTLQPNDNDLKRFRSCFDVSQAYFASQMGMPLRTYEDLEAGRAQVKPVHIRAAEMALYQIAFDRMEFDALPEKQKIILRGLKDLIK